MEQNENSLRDYVAVLKRRKNLMLLTFLGLLVLSILVTFLWPPTYRSTATILIRDQEIPRDLVPSTITSFADQRLMEIQARVVTSANLARLIDDFDLYPDERKRLPTTEVVEDMREDYSLDLVSADVIDPRTGRPTQATILFTVSFDYESPAIAQQVTNRLVNLYLNENLRDRTERAQETTSFLSDQAEKLNREINQLEARMARFKEQNGGALPELYSLNLQMMDRTEAEMREIQRQFQALNEQKIFLQGQLATQSPQGPLYTREGAVLPPNEQLMALQSQYTTLSATYGANHPDVVSVRRQIQALEGEVGQVDVASLESETQRVYAELTDAKQRYGASHPDVLRLERQYERLVAERDSALAAAEVASDKEPTEPNITNPAFVALQTQLSAADSEARSLQARYAQLEEKLDDYEQRIVTAPQVEREYSGITRDLESARMKYQEIHAKQLAAEVAESLEQGRKGERFEVVEPALLPTLPHTPNRLALLFLGLVLSMAGSVGTTAVSESMDRSVHGPRGLAEVLGAPPIATIPFIANELDTSRDKRTLWMIAAGVAAAILLVLVLVHFLYRPLDILWFTLLRKLGI
ncbi:MAG: lipopolysaccharide biosynthesis protein [Gammaproteobacteria bacterium]|nr:lipopolysaccharide biosynthesis protein [Gammaproteobacteria bacterium]NNF62549.1 lipopolysaccharide biosynthesis protein [Gammaproteobacteria bacterium]NNM20748.1 lipopolysaccharide biosynthesis protein [Gammaproteobacteria bacterium]